MHPAQWALVQYRLPGGPQTWSGALVAGAVAELPGALADQSLMSIVADWDAVTAELLSWAPEQAAPVAGAILAAPLTYPRAILCAGANYYSHAAEMGTAVPDPDAEPFFFLKPPATTVIGPGDSIPYPAYPSAQLDWEAELGVVICHRIKNVRWQDAASHVAGYVVANDVSARDRARRADAVSPHFSYDWLGHKGQDGFCPLGPGIVPSWQVSDPQQLPLRLSVNGVIKQEASTADMVISVERLIAAASRVLTLEPGDVILTGTPAGVGMPRGEFLAPGDWVVAEIDGIGMLANQVVAA